MRSYRCVLRTSPNRMVGFSFGGAVGAAEAAAAGAAGAGCSRAGTCTGFPSEAAFLGSGRTSAGFLAPRSTVFGAAFAAGAAGACGGFSCLAGACGLDGASATGAASARGARMTRTPLISDP
ncbi:MAG: hypothetical protein AUI83_04265 [Armatimonadetes bacterium 13_1_40CM_3_65_7]|nr:MAG: hypothetical protein AUI83_04265 [Armatimonadetes bacterium 13_1_40CM_3_65_7]